MVLQQLTDVNVWGWAEPGETIRVVGSWNETLVVEALTDAQGKWSTQLPTPAASDVVGSQTLTVSGRNTLVFEDVLIGEVWVLSGQSNMSIPLVGWDDAPIEGSADAIAAADHASLRLMVVGEYSASTEQDDIHSFWDSRLRQWSVCTPDSVRYFSALGYFFGKELLSRLGDVPVGLVQCAWAGSSCEAWVSPADLEQVAGYRGEGPWNSTSSGDNQTASVLWNGMLKPILPYSMKGVLWYQGETNMGRAEELTRLFPQMIEGWRREWRQGDFPFCFAQLAPWSQYWPGQEPEFWEAQASTLFLPNTGMVTTLDLVDADELGNIHPKRKAPIAQRMAQWAMAKVYGMHVLEYSGPVYRSMQVVGDALVLQFDHANSGLVSKTGSLDWFELAGHDGLYYPAEAVMVGSQVELRSSWVPSPAQARYAWSKVAAGDLFNLEGLPAASFRTQPADYLVSHLGNPVVPEGWNGGFYQRNGYLMDPEGTRVKGYGVNLLVGDFDKEGGPIAASLLPAVRGISNANTLRIVWNTTAKGSVAESARRLDEILASCIGQEMLPVLSFSDLVGSKDGQALRAMVGNWMQTEYLEVFRKYENSMLLELSAGWSAPASTEWHDAVHDAITILRTWGGGVRCPLVVEAADGGSDLTSIETYGRQLVSHDPCASVIFGLKLNVTQSSEQKEEVAQDSAMQQMGSLKAAGFPMLVTALKLDSASFDETMALQMRNWKRFCNELGLGYLAWVWCGDPLQPATNLTGESDWTTLTPWGMAVLSGANGIRNLAVVAPSLTSREADPTEVPAP